MFRSSYSPSHGGYAYYIILLPSDIRHLKMDQENRPRLSGEVWGKSRGSLFQTLPLSQSLSTRPFREIGGSGEVFFKISSFQRSH